MRTADLQTKQMNAHKITTTKTSNINPSCYSPNAWHPFTTHARRNARWPQVGWGRRQRDLFFLQNPNGAPRYGLRACKALVYSLRRLGTQLRGSILYHSCVCPDPFHSISTTNHTARKPSIITIIIMPSRKSVRFEDLDDGAEDGVYGLKVCRVYARPWCARPGLYVLVSTLRPLFYACRRACMRPAPIPPLSHTPHHHHHFPSHPITQGMFNNLYAQATSYGKWARSHSKTVRDSVCRGGS